MANKQDLLLYSIAATENEGGIPLNGPRASMRSLLLYVGVTRCSKSVVLYTHSLYRHTLVTMSARKKAKCEETMMVSHSTMESERCEDEANNQHIVQPKLLRNLNHYAPHTRHHSRMPDGRIMVYYERIECDEEYLLEREQFVERRNFSHSIIDIWAMMTGERMIEETKVECALEQICFSLFVTKH